MFSHLPKLVFNKIQIVAYSWHSLSIEVLSLLKKDV